MTDIETQKEDYQPGPPGSDDRSGSNDDWVEFDPQTNLPPISKNGDGEVYETGMSDIVTAPVCPQLEDCTSDMKVSSNSVIPDEPETQSEMKLQSCTDEVDAGVDIVSSLADASMDCQEIKDETDSNVPEIRSKEHIFQILMEDERASEAGDNNEDDQIYYLPLAVGSSAGKSEQENLELTKIAGLDRKNQSDNVLRDLGKPLSKMAESSGSPTSISNDSASNTGSRPLSQVESSTPSESTTNSSFLSSKSTLITDSLLKTGTIPESITQQFNQIAKLNKSSLRSRRTVRTTTTRVTPGQLASNPVTSSGKITGKESSSEPINVAMTGFSGRPTTEISMFNRLAQGLQSSTSSSSSPQASSFIHPDAKAPIHARFHSDETKPMTDFVSPTRWHSITCSGEQTSPIATSESAELPACSPRQPVTYMRSVTAERLPVFIRSDGCGSVSTAGVLRSKSTAGTIPANRRVPHGTVVPGEHGTSTETHRSLPESALGSHGYNSTRTGSEDGSTGSLPSLSAGAVSNVEAESPAPTGSDSELPIKSSCESTSLSNQKLDGSAQAATGTGSEPIGISDDSYLTLLKRRHIMKELIHVEKEYVNALATLVNSYMIPLKQEKILDDQQVDTIFYKINDLFKYHMSFLNTLQMWERTNTVGDKLLDMFSREAVAACYCSFVENFPNSEKTLEACWNTKSSFQKFCEQKLRTMRSKLPLKALLVQPIQRIPRYELLVKRLIEYTPEHFSDNALLNEARNAIHRLAVRVNTVQADGQDESMIDGTKLLDRLLAPATLTPNRVYIRHDIVSLEDRKDPVCIFMFTDQIVFTVAKRRGTQMMKKPMFLRLQSPKGVDTIENIKYKIFHRLGIEAIEFEPCDGSESDRSVQHRELRDKKDLALLAEIENISTKLDYRHHDLDAVVRSLYQSVQQELEDLRNARCAAANMPKNLSVFTATTKEGIERYELTFPSNEKRKDWERTVMELKRQLSSVKRTSHFFGSVEIPRTLSGIQLSCSAVVEVTHLTKATPRDVWICASDGYTGYICLLTLQPRPMIYLNIPLAGCNSPITCICAVPGSPAPNIRRVSHGSGLSSSRGKFHFSNAQSVNTPRLSLSKSNENVEITGLESRDRSKSENAVQVDRTVNSDPTRDIMNRDDVQTSSTRKSSGSQLDDDSATLCYCRTQTSNSPLITPPDTPTLQQVHEDPDDVLMCGSEQLELGTGELPNSNSQTMKPYFAREIKCPSEPSLQDAAARTIDAASPSSDLLGDSTRLDEQDIQASDYSDSSDVSDGDNDAQDETSSSQTTQTTSKESSNEAPADTFDFTRNQKMTRLLDPHRSTMWLGTEDGTIFIFYANDNIKTSRQRQQIKLPSGITSILQLDVRIFVSCTNGDFFVYERNADGLWDVDCPRLLHIDPEQGTTVVVRRMLAVAGNIWCAAHRFVYVLNSVTLKVELSFPLNGNPADPRGIQLMAYGNQTVWLATENSPRVSLYHATTGEFLMEIDLKPIVIQSLRHCDEIIIRHKEACLRITCLTVCKDLLWAGTSAGAIVTVAIPRVTVTSTRHSMEPPQLEVLKQGHIGHVRFLVSLESISETDMNNPLERQSFSLSPMHEANDSTPKSGQRLMSSGDQLCKEAIEKTDLSSEGRPASSIDDKRTLQAELNCASPSIRSPQPPPRPKPPNLANIKQSTGSDSVPIERVSSSDVLSPMETRLSISPSHRHYLLGIRRASVNPCTTIATQMKVISGGDGLETFNISEVSSSRPESGPNEELGNDDSINQILIWDVH